MIVLRPATMADAGLLLRWRNDPATRAASVNPAEVGRQEHLAWLEASLRSPTRTLLVAELDGAPVGTVRIDRGAETELSWTVAPGHRGKGLGKAMVQAAVPEGDVVARIARDNAASQAIALAAGFTLEEDGALQRWRRASRRS